MTLEFIKADCLKWMREQPDGRFDLAFGSPPYADARLYLEDGQDLGISRNCVQWVEWMLEVTREAHRISRGPVIWVAAAMHRDRNYWPACEGLMWEWWKLGGDHQLYRPCVFHRVGIPGSGGSDWFRADWEYVMCFKHEGELPWSDNTACGHPPKWAPGGEMSYRNSEGTRRNQWGAKTGVQHDRNQAGELVGRARPSHQDLSNRDRWGGTGHASSGEGRSPNGKHKTRPSKRFAHAKDGTVKGEHDRDIVAIANPGNVWNIPVGGGLMASRLCHENEAPFPERLAEIVVRSCCPPDGLVLDPFSGSGTTASVCRQHNRNCIGIDLRESQVELAQRRTRDAQPRLLDT
jgi:hypothetical protein